MSEREPTSVVFLRYWLFQLPGLFVAGVVLSVLAQWDFVSTNVALLLFGFWVLKDIVLFPVTRVGYERGGGRHGAEALLGADGVVTEEIGAGRTGWVRVGPERWRARGEEEGSLPVGTAVRVAQVDGLVLVVEREES